MSSIRRITLLAVVVAAVAALTASPATAASANMCPADGAQWFISYADGSVSFANEAAGGGCVYVRSYPAGYLRLDFVILSHGWTYVVRKNGEGTSSRVELQFTDLETGRKVDFRVEYGKTKVS
jgi:hypothetical protein